MMRERKIIRVIVQMPAETISVFCETDWELFCIEVSKNEHYVNFRKTLESAAGFCYNDN